MPKKNLILVTGGAGFVGTNLIKLFLEKTNYNIISLDDYSSGYKINHVKNSKVKYIKGKTSNINTLIKNPSRIKTIFHFGEFARIYQSFLKMNECIESNSVGSNAVFNFCLKHNIKLIYSATSASLGNKGNDKNLSPYAFTKSKNLELLENLKKWFNFKYEVIYFYNVYGGRELRDGKYSTVIGKFKRLVSQGETKLPVTTPGTQLRNFTHVDDIINGILLAAAKGAGDGYGIGSNESYSIIDVCREFGCEPEFQAASPANRMHGELRTEKIKDLGWTQKHFLKAHISSFLKSISGTLTP